MSAIFNRFHRRICIFHYAGHAGGEGLQLEEGGGNASGLAALFRQQSETLAMVFLNGCSTLGQVDRLLELGIKAVIATSVSVEDEKAMEFAVWFYQALSVRRSLKNAFDFAVASLQTKYQESDQLPRILYRDRMEEEVSGKQFPWGLYVNGENEKALSWQMPDTPIRTFLTNPRSNYKPNDYLPRILGAMQHFDPTLKKVIEAVKEGKMDKREVLPIIVQQLPWTIGAQLQKLISRSESMRMPGLERLYQTVHTYRIAAQMMLYILLSQLWEEKRKHPEIKIEPHLLDILELEHESVLFYDYVAAFAQVGRLFRLQGWQPFIKEFDVIFDELEQKKQIFQAYLLLESINEQLERGNFDAASAIALCEEAEHALTIFIGRISFLINYKMVAIRDISVTSYRYSKVEYLHTLGSLNAADSSYLTLDSDPKSFGTHAESGSVLLVNDLVKDRLEQYLSLSPFIIDNNAFLDKSQEALDIFVFSYSDQDQYCYQNVNHQVQKLHQHDAYHLHTGYEERIEVKDEVDFGWEIHASQTKIIRPYALLKTQFERMKTELLDSPGSDPLVPS